jgi:hypothetical protein
MSLKLVVSILIQRDICQLISFFIKIIFSVPFSKYHTFIFIIGSEEVIQGAVFIIQAAAIIIIIESLLIGGCI